MSKEVPMATATEAKEQKSYNKAKTQFDKATTSALRSARDQLVAGEEALKELESRVRWIEIRLPVAEFELDGYAVSVRSPSRHLKEKRISHEEGLALGALKLGMQDAGMMCLGASVQRPVSAKEDVLLAILDQVVAAVQKRGGWESLKPVT